MSTLKNRYYETTLTATLPNGESVKATLVGMTTSKVRFERLVRECEYAIIATDFGRIIESAVNIYDFEMAKDELYEI